MTGAPAVERPSPSRGAVLAATVLGLGFAPFAPGTVTSAAVSALAFVPGAPGPAGFAAAGVLVALLGIPAASSAERRLGHDASPITIDEAAGMLMTLAAAPRTPAGVLLAFLLFRAFDVVKPPPANALQALPRGLGVVADDVAAAAYAAATLGVLRLFRLPWLFGTS